MKKILAGVLIVILAAITIMQYIEALKIRQQPPSEKWAKEALIDTGDITDYPQIIKYKDNYVVAHNDGSKIKILMCDNLGKKIKEKAFDGEGQNVSSAHLVTNGDQIDLVWLSYAKPTRNAHIIRLDKDFNVIDKNIINDVGDLKQAGNDLLIIGYKDKIELRDYTSGKVTMVDAPDNDLITGTKIKDKYYISFQDQYGDFQYLTVDYGVPSSLKPAGALKGTVKVGYYNTAMGVQGDKGFIIAEYRYEAQYGYAKLMEFSLIDGTYKIREIADKKKLLQFYNIVSYTYSDDSKFMAGGTRSFGKKFSMPDILEITAENGIVASQLAISRTPEVSLYPTGYGDTVVFCDSVKEGKAKLYMTSTREDFKKANNGPRSNEYTQAFVDLFQSFIFSFVYMLSYGAAWIIPSLCIVSLITLLNYKLRNKQRKFTFILAYFLSFLVKTFFIYSIIYSRFKPFLPSYMTLEAGIGAILLISVVCCLYAFKGYTSDMEKSAMPVSFSPAFLIDSWITLFLFVPFLR